MPSSGSTVGSRLDQPSELVKSNLVQAQADTIQVGKDLEEGNFAVDIPSIYHPPVGLQASE